MAITNQGLEFIASAIVGPTTWFNESNAYIGVGDSDEPFDATQINLQGASVRKGMDSGYPVVDGPKVTFKSIFLPDEANFTWREWGIFNDSLSGTMLDRVVENNSTKLPNQTWTIEIEITFVSL